MYLTNIANMAVAEDNCERVILLYTTPFNYEHSAGSLKF